MTFEQWWDSLGVTIPTNPQKVARMAWEAGRQAMIDERVDDYARMNKKRCDD